MPMSARNDFGGTVAGRVKPLRQRVGDRAPARDFGLDETSFERSSSSELDVRVQTAADTPASAPPSIARITWKSLLVGQTDLNCQPTD
jgi:hypothetical protein